MKEMHKQVAVIGGGPAGYSAAFRAADLGMDVALIEKNSYLGGVCLNEGCIPSKALLHIAEILEETRSLKAKGIFTGDVACDIPSLQTWKQETIQKLSSGLTQMARLRKLTVIQGTAEFMDAHHLKVTGEDDAGTSLSFEHAVIAAGSRPVQLPFLPNEDSRVWDSTDALALSTIPDNLLVIGGGIIGLEMATVYTALGSSVHVVEFLPQIVPAADKDVVQAYTRIVKDRYSISTNTKVTAMEARDDGLHLSFEGKQAAGLPHVYDAALVAVGRRPDSKSLQADKAGISTSQQGYIEVDNQQRTSAGHIYAIGDITGNPMLAHKGAYQAHIAAEAIAGKKHYFEPLTIPNVAYTCPEMAWIGHTEKSAKEEGIDYEAATFPWNASGRALASNTGEGFTKLLMDKRDGRIIGGAAVGAHSSELLGEIGLAIEMEANAEDLALTIHAHPTLYETIGRAAEIYQGVITDFPNRKAGL